MALKCFVGFDHKRTQTAFLDPAGSVTTMGEALLPRGVYHERGLSTLDRTLGPDVKSGTYAFYGAQRYGSGTMAGGYLTVGNFTAATTPTRATMLANKAYMFALVRSTYSIAEEVYFSMDWLCPDTHPAATGLTGYEPTSDYLCIFRWGDLSVRFKSSTYDSATAQYTQVFSLKNGASEVATITVPGILLATTYSHIRVYAKLDGAAGALTVTINGVAQSATYTGQNTVATTSLAAATDIHFGPWAADNGTNAYIGLMDNACFFTGAHDTGRPMSFMVGYPGTDGTATLTNWSYAGGGSAFANTANQSQDAPSLRASATGATFTIGITSPGTTGFASAIFGFTIGVKRISRRNVVNNCRLTVGMSLAGTPTKDTVIAGLEVPFDTSAYNGNGPATSYVYGVTDMINNGYTTADFATIKLYLEATAYP